MNTFELFAEGSCAVRSAQVISLLRGFADSSRLIQ
jgi:hypothetical protein